jgi:hypothetical protein
VRDEKRLTRLLCEKIETIDPGFGIEIMRLAATLAEPLAPKQTVSSLTEEPEADISGLVDTLVNRVGDQRLYRFAPVASDVPERSVRRIAPTAPDTGDAWPDHWPRPSRLLSKPEPIETVALLRLPTLDYHDTVCVSGVRAPHSSYFATYFADKNATSGGEAPALLFCRRGGLYFVLSCGATFFNTSNEPRERVGDGVALGASMDLLITLAITVL